MDGAARTADDVGIGEHGLAVPVLEADPEARGADVGGCDDLGGLGDHLLGAGGLGPGAVDIGDESRAVHGEGHEEVALVVHEGGEA